MYNDAYSLRVFPFSHGQSRKVRICYSCPVSISGGKAVMQYPFDIAQNASAAPERMSLSVGLTGVDPERVSVHERPLSAASITADQAGGTRVSMVADDGSRPEQVRLFWDIQLEKTNGITASFTRSKEGDVSFMALVEPSTATGATASRKKNILVLWNMVSYRKGLYCHYLTGSNYTCDTTRDTTYEGGYRAYHLREAAGELIEFVGTRLQPGDRFNIIVNTSEVSRLYDAPEPWTPAMADDLAAFLEDRIDTGSVRKGCTHPVDFLLEGVSTVQNSEHLDLIIVDRSSSYQRPFDSAYVDDMTSRILRILPTNTVAFGLIGYSWNNPVARIQNAILQARKGMGFYSWGSFGPIFNSIGKALTPYLNPAALSFDCESNAFPYEVYGPAEERFYLGFPVMYTGKIHGDPRRLNITFNTAINGKTYRIEQGFDVPDHPDEFDGIDKVWAAQKVHNLTYQQSHNYALTEYKEALNISLEHRILTRQTALIAFEPGLMDSIWYEDDASVDTDFRNVVATREHSGSRKGSTPHMVTRLAGMTVRIRIEGLSREILASGHSLKVYDLRGRLVCDLSKRLRLKGSSVALLWDTGTVAKGVYLIRFHAGPLVLSSSIRITR
jgi:hypothetical protein